MKPLEKIDFVFFYIKDKINAGGQWGYNNIWNHVKETKEVEINETMFKEIIKKLLNDGYITETQINEGQNVYNLTFEGQLFDGYLSQAKEISKLSNETRRWSALVTAATVVGGIYALFEILKWILNLCKRN